MTSTIVAPPRLERAKQVGPVFGLVAWTLFTWVNRIRNVANDTALVGADRTWAMSVALAFTGAALALGALALSWVAGDANPVSRRLSRAALALAVVGAAWWAVRGVQIVLHDHSFGFKAVHTVLALITIGLGLLVVRWTRRLAL